MSDGQAPQKQDFFAALVRTFDTDDGRLILRWLHTTAATRAPSTIPLADGRIDPYATHYRDGRKSILHELEARLEEARASFTTQPSDAPQQKARPTPRSRRQGP